MRARHILYSLVSPYWIAKRASDVMTQTRLRQTNWNGGWFWSFLSGQKPVFLKHLWNKNVAYIPCISFRTRLCWPSLAGNSVICIPFLEFVHFAISKLVNILPHSKPPRAHRTASRRSGLFCEQYTRSDLSQTCRCDNCTGACVSSLRLGHLLRLFFNFYIIRTLWLKTWTSSNGRKKNYLEQLILQKNGILS